jgi:CHAT domain-containing protein
MKILFSLLAIAMLGKDCEQNKAVGDSTVTVNSENMSNATQEHTTIWYQASTRGFYEKIWISKDSLTVTMDRNQIEKTSYPTPQEDWIELMALIKGVDISELPNLKAPTSKRHYDGAAFATLAISQNKLETKTESFDHGDPPKAIELLVNKVLSMKEMHEKN